jgi:hypothetical protein
MALAIGAPVARSQSRVVSRWLVTPTAARSRGAMPSLAIAAETTPDTLAQISMASCSTQPGRGKICRCSTWARSATAPAASKIMQREEVVPWSMAAM